MAPAGRVYQVSGIDRGVTYTPGHLKLGKARQHGSFFNGPQRKYLAVVAFDGLVVTSRLSCVGLQDDSHHVVTLAYN